MSISHVRRARPCKARGFSVVELLLVVTIILIVAAIAIPNLVSAIDLARVGRAVADINTLEEEIALYQSINNVFPDDLSQVGYGNYLDPWGNPYQYVNHATMMGNGEVRTDRFGLSVNSDYDVYSNGKDGQSSSSITASASQDDIIRAADGAYVGLAAQF